MKVLIVEDEKLAQQHLQEILTDLDTSISVSACLDSVTATIEFLNLNKVDLIFLDIHLADDVSFKIFDQIEVSTPIIFTTAYDKYAIRAFKLNSIAYILKPIIAGEVKDALEKYKSLYTNIPDWSRIREMIIQPAHDAFQSRFLVKKGDHLASVKVEDIAYFEGEDRYVYLVRKDGQRFFIDEKLNSLEGQLDPQWFFRLNRSFICHYDSIDQILAVSKSRVKVSLIPNARREIIVSTENTRSFKEWLSR
ncbi:MAG: response regulator transcription factor [Saprospiraceae bacterium]|nr:response regulator transcription factor [Saprospiraceae bacterium]